MVRADDDDDKDDEDKDDTKGRDVGIRVEAGAVVARSTSDMSVRSASRTSASSVESLVEVSTSAEATSFLAGGSTVEEGGWDKGEEEEEDEPRTKGEDGEEEAMIEKGDI